MAQLDEIKESIGYLKVIFSISIAVNISLVAWIYKNFLSFNLQDIVIFLSLAVIISIWIIYINRIILIKIKSLRDL